jgi:uncharacterized Tic20 family protein
MSTPSGSELSDERSTGGILVHLLGLFTGFFGPIILYAVSEDEFTRTNARHAINWHVTLFVLAIAAVVMFVLGADEITILGDATAVSLVPAPFDVAFGLVGFLLVIALVIATFLTFVYTIIATIKAISGSVWTYPGAIGFVERFR